MHKYLIVAKCYDKKGKLISIARNSYTKTHPKQAKFAKDVGEPLKIYLHAEVAAIIKAGERSVYKIKVERFGKRGDKLPSKPCPICMAAIKHFGISIVQYTV